ncbi:hypothetical protein ALQ37_200075 [Pseudomonas syringae pv. aptata]|uniref:Uncharacterized protein n=1 Tax=Pseudomonas syringae pv. aptata TaxID=83167 RepID=A0A3M3WC50_PSEAP|nr:hypothetical protein ALQ37_200075 [Pseudomonas syringae pv. aptata]
MPASFKFASIPCGLSNRCQNVSYRPRAGFHPGATAQPHIVADAARLRWHLGRMNASVWSRTIVSFGSGYGERLASRFWSVVAGLDGHSRPTQLKTVFSESVVLSLAFNREPTYN